MEEKSLNNRGYKFDKEKKLKSRKVIQHLFDQGKAFSSFPVKVLYGFVEEGAVPVKAGVTVSSRNFKKAVHRNRIKRVLRECYRLQQKDIEDTVLSKNLHLVLFFIYTGKEMPVFTTVFEKVGMILEKINSSITSKPAILP